MVGQGAGTPAVAGVVTFDLFSALLDSRRGGTAVFDRLARSGGWPVSGGTVYGRWDALNKSAQNTSAQQQTAPRDVSGWVSYRELAGRALADTYVQLGIDSNVELDLASLVASMADWPLWPDVAEVLPRLAENRRIGLLSNVDDDIYASTRAAVFVEPDLAMTSQRLQAYKPGERIYVEARRRLGPMVHVATSPRDVRGALEAHCPVVRLRRPGHGLDPDGPSPRYEADGAADLERVLALVAPG